MLIDDHPLFLEAMQMTLSAAIPNRRIEVANRLAEALEFKGPDAFDLIVLDLNLPDVDGLDGLIRIRSQFPQAPVVVVSSLSETRISQAVRHAGGAGLIPKDSSRTDIVTAIRRVLAGLEISEEGEVAAEPGADDQAEIIGRMKSLTPQQGTILRMICEGKLNKQIAWELDIAETTVKAHVTAILRKMKAHSRTHAVILVQNTRFDQILP